MERKKELTNWEFSYRFLTLSFIGIYFIGISMKVNFFLGFLSTILYLVTFYYSYDLESNAILIRKRSKGE